MTDELCQAVAGTSRRGRSAIARELQRLPDPAGPDAGLVPIPPAVSRVPPRRAPPRGAGDRPAACTRAAAAWYQSRRITAMAIDHLLQTPDLSAAAALIAEVGLGDVPVGRLVTLQRWMRAPRRPRDPRAPADAGPHRMDGGALRRCGRGGTVGGRRGVGSMFEGAPGDGSASFSSARAMLRAVMCAAGTGADAGGRRVRARRRAVVERVARRRAVRRRGCAACCSATPTGRPSTSSRSSTRTTDSGNIGARVLSHTQLAMIYMARGRWAEAGRPARDRGRADRGEAHPGLRHGGADVRRAGAAGACTAAISRPPSGS